MEGTAGAKAVVPGGFEHRALTAAELDTRLDFNDPAESRMSGAKAPRGLVVLDETYSMVDFLYNSCRFFAHESCGQCTPCREGTALGVAMLERIRCRAGRLKDLDLLLEIADSIGIIPGTTICGLADGAAWPIKNAIRKFRNEFEDYIRKTNPAGCMASEPAAALVDHYDARLAAGLARPAGHRAEKLETNKQHIGAEV